MSELKQRDNILDFIRGICVLFVIITHFEYSFDAYHKLLFPFWIDIAVPGFMFISGYVRSNSYKNRDIDLLKQAYDIKLLIKNILRLTIPFLFIFILEEIIIFSKQAIQPAKYYIYTLIIDFLEGGHGPGSYYYPVMIQFIFIFPLLYFLIKRYKQKGLFISFVLNILYELIKYLINLNFSIYRLLVFRYIFIISYGIYLGLNKKNDIKKPLRLISFILGLVFIIYNEYIGLDNSFINYYPNTSLIACLYFAEILSILIENLKFKNKFLELLGKASYNIFLVQMFYYKYISIDLSKTFLFVLSFIICLCFGLLFYYLEKRFLKLKIK